MTTKPHIWPLDPPDVTVEDVFRAEGANYSKRPPQPGTLELHRQVLAEAATLVRPVMIWRAVDILGAGERELFLDGGQKLTSPLLVRVAGGAQHLIMFAITMGEALDRRGDYYSRGGKTLASFILDAAGTALMVKSSLEAVRRLDEYGRSAGLGSTFPMGPGHSYWPLLEDMRVILHLLQAEQIGLRLTANNLMLPRKSIAMVLGQGRQLPDLQGKTHCHFCSLQKKCQLSHCGHG